MNDTFFQYMSNEGCFIYLFIYNNRALGTRITYIYLHIHTDTNTRIQTDKQINDIKFKNIKISILYLHFF